MIFKRLKNLWYLSGLDIASDSYRKVTLEVPKDMDIPKRKLATIIEMDEIDMFV